ncbi:hypothetical protein TL16_g04511 [Triparma laevis f. inornata]|uniref:Uncharacterized protein n=2 Tax=Triparma laevis TaxID=1534972 RepID=A0A9W7AHM9_9STRA|nr:hypothetical protein TL16_g04511 [Triparma laevis f. inornata]GMH68514.1 hypothetical protein TrLO_g2282 [Triparma laevis f. longispina]
MTQTWTIHLGKAGSTTITYDPGEGDFVTVNGMQLRVRHLQPSTSFSSFSERRFFTNYTGYRLEFAPRKRGVTGKFTGAKKLYEMKVDGKLVEEEKKNFRDMACLSGGGFKIPAEMNEF